MGFEEASPIQAQAIPVQAEGRDIVGQAQTGTGKTAAFGIPMLQKIDPKVKKLQAVALCPTRELAIQVADEIRRLAKYMHGVKVLPIYGGQDIVKQIRSLKDGTQIIIGTPGRVMDHMRRKTVKFEHVHTVVMDEADEMLNMGFLEDMETILSQLPEERQTVMFSATMPSAIMEIARKFQQEPVTVKVVKKELTVPKVTQYYYEVKPKSKVEVMCRLLDMYAPKLSVAFCNTKKQVDELVQALQGRGYFAEGLHGDLKQIQRDRVMNSFRNGKTQIIPQAIPSLNDVTAIKVDKILENVADTIGDTDLSKMVNIIEKKLLEEDYTSLDLAAALLKMIMGEENEDIIDTREPRSLDNLENLYGGGSRGRSSRNGNGSGNGRGGRSDSSREDMARLFINIGKNQNVKPGDILGAIAGESGMPGKMVGSIDMYDKYTFVEVPRESADTVLQAMKDVKIKGKNIHMEKANGKGR